MSIKINKPFFASSLLLLSTEICIAAFLTSGFIRHTFGDFLATILLYCIIRSFLNIKPLYIAITVLIIAFSIEFLQLLNFLDYLELRNNTLIVTILGSTFSIGDLIAYSLGIITIFLIDIKTHTT